MFKRQLRRFVECLRTGTWDPALRVKRVSGYLGVWEMSWAPDGRATFSCGREQTPGDPHIVWRRIGGHQIFKNP